jgi:hypothetical protein
MAMVPQPWPEPAAEVARAVRAKYHGREVPLTVRDRFGELFAHAEFARAFGVTGPQGWSPGRLALVTVFQMAENPTASIGACQRVRHHKFKVNKM